MCCSFTLCVSCVLLTAFTVLVRLILDCSLLFYVCYNNNNININNDDININDENNNINNDNNINDDDNNNINNDNNNNINDDNNYYNNKRIYDPKTASSFHLQLNKNR